MAQQQRAYSGGPGGGKAYTTLDGKLTPKGLQALRAWAKDAGFSEANVKRDEGGKFSAQQHQAAAAQHQATAAKHPDKSVAKAHADAAQAHTLAAQHIAAQTGWQEHNAQKAHNASKMAEQAEANAGGAANAEQLKAIASDPSKPLSARAEAVKQLEGMQQQADLVAGSPLAVPQPKPAAPAQQPLNISPAMKAKLAGALKPAAKLADGRGPSAFPSAALKPGGLAPLGTKAEEKLRSLIEQYKARGQSMSWTSKEEADAHNKRIDAAQAEVNAEKGIKPAAQKPAVAAPKPAAPAKFKTPRFSEKAVRAWQAAQAGNK